MYTQVLANRRWARGCGLREKYSGFVEASREMRERKKERGREGEMQSSAMRYACTCTECTVVQYVYTVYAYYTCVGRITLHLFALGMLRLTSN